jgi:hypothetical protein
VSGTNAVKFNKYLSLCFRYGDAQAEEEAMKKSEGDWEDYQFYENHILNPDKLTTGVSARLCEMQCK